MRKRIQQICSKPNKYVNHLKNSQINSQAEYYREQTPQIFPTPFHYNSKNYHNPCTHQICLANSFLAVNVAVSITKTLML